MKEFAGKVAAVTGAANGIGKAFAEEAAGRGMKLALIDLEEGSLKAVKKECEELGSPKVLCLTVDVSVYAQVRLSVARIMDTFGQIDLFFNNAGVCGAGWIDQIPPQDWEWIFSVDVYGQVYYVHEVLPIMIRQKTPCHFLFTSSIAGLNPGFRWQSAYMSAKHASLALAESVRDYADNMTDYMGVSVFCPEFIKTTIDESEKRRPSRFQKPQDAYYTSGSYLDYVQTFHSKIQNLGANPRFVGPRLFQAIEDNQMYIVPHVHTHQAVYDRHRRIEADMKRDEELYEQKYKSMMGWDD